AVPLCEAHRFLVRAAGSETATEAVRSLAAVLTARLEAEYPGLDSRSDSSSGVVHGSLTVGAFDQRGVGAPGIGEFEPHRRGVLALDDWRGLRGTIDLGLFAHDRFACRVAPVATADRTRLEALEGVVGLGPVAVTVGRGSIGYGAATGGGVTLGGGR